MRPVLYVLTFLSLIALGFWAYRENYATQAALREVRGLQRQISDLREGLAVQKAEWAYLNRPERLRDLVGLNFERLPLLPFQPGQFGDAAQVAYPAILGTGTGGAYAAQTASSTAPKRKVTGVAATALAPMEEGL